MAIEKVWESIPDRALTSDGTSEGSIQVTNVEDYRVGQKVVLKSDTASKTLKINAITASSIELGDETSNINGRADVSMFLVADNAALYLPRQPRVRISNEDTDRAVYEEEPVVAIRTILVDNKGNKISTTNPIAVNVVSGGGGGGGGETEPYLTYQLNEFEDTGAGTLYVGKAEPGAKWLVERIVETGGSLSKKYANISNNPTRTTFSQAWTNRATLNYVDFQVITGL